MISYAVDINLDASARLDSCVVTAFIASCTATRAVFERVSAAEARAVIAEARAINAEAALGRAMAGSTFSGLVCTNGAGTDKSKPSSLLIGTADAARQLGIARGTLDRMRDRAPRGLPGSPVRVGSGPTNRTWRWPAARLQDWADAYEAWRATRGRRK